MNGFFPFNFLVDILMNHEKFLSHGFAYKRYFAKMNKIQPVVTYSKLHKYKIMSVEFSVPEYTREGSFKFARYMYCCNSDSPSDSGWTIYHDGSKVLTLGEGYILVKGKYCGICSTDLARRF